MRRILVCLSLVALVSGCSDDVVQPPTGDLVVSVNDISLDAPVADVEITVDPAGITSATDDAGVVILALAPGDYVVRATVSWKGPAQRAYAVPTTVTAGETVAVQLEACQLCN